MTALDQAFLKAYRVVPGTADDEPLAEVIEDRPLREARLASAAARHERVIAALSSDAGVGTSKRNRTNAKVGDAGQGKSTNQDPADDLLGAPNIAPPAFLQQGVADSPRAKQQTPAEENDLESPVLHGAHLHGAHEHPRGPHRGRRGNPAAGGDETEPRNASREHPTNAEPHDSPLDADSCEEPLDPEYLEELDAIAAGEESSGSTSIPLTPMQPMLQVDCFEWPEVCNLLVTQASDTLDDLAETVMQVTRRGHRAIGLASAASGQGATTLLVTLARRLAREDASVVLVDAAVHRPELATRLGVAAEYGWEELGGGHLPLEEYVIESVLDKISLLPLCKRLKRPAEQPDLLDPFVTALRDLRRHYDVVLVDLGPTAADNPEEPLVLCRAVDLVLLVRDARSQADSGLLRLHRRLSRAGVTVAGTVEMFFGEPLATTT